ncbi:hypothetical protein H1R20_g6721, partial [Candolleomyces eurysporus]
MSTPEEAQAAFLALVEGYHATKYVLYLVRLSSKPSAGSKELRNNSTARFVMPGDFQVADFIHTFPDEVRLIWPTPLSIPKVLFLVVRYYAFINCVFALQYGLPIDMSPEGCHKNQWLIATEVSTMVMIVLAEAILLIRLYAFSGRDKRLFAFLIVQWLRAMYVLASSSTATRTLIKSVGHQDVELPVKNIVCIPAAAETRLFAVVFALFLAGVCVVMFTMLIILFLKYKSVNSSLVSVFFRDGAFYFVCLSAIATANLIVNVASAPAYKFLLSQPEANLHAILSTRMLLHLRSSLEHERNQGRSTYTRDAWTSVYDVSGSGSYPFKRKRRGTSPMRFNEWESRDTERTEFTS